MASIKLLTIVNLKNENVEGCDKVVRHTKLLLEFGEFIILDSNKNVELDK